MTKRMSNQERIEHAERLLTYYTTDKHMERRHWKVINFLRTIKNLARKKRTPTAGQRKFFEDLIARGKPEVVNNPEAEKYEKCLPYINNDFQLSAAKDLIASIRNNFKLSEKQQGFLDKIVKEAKANMESESFVFTVEKLHALETLYEAMAYFGNTSKHRKSFLKKQFSIQCLMARAMRNKLKKSDEEIVENLNYILSGEIVSYHIDCGDPDIFNWGREYNVKNAVKLYERDWDDVFEMYDDTIRDIAKIKSEPKFAVGNMIQFKTKHVGFRGSFVQGLVRNSNVKLAEDESPVCLVVNSPYVKHGNIHYYQNGIVIDVMIGTEVFTCGYKYFSKAKIKGL